jgi:hypothetical protein
MPKRGELFKAAILENDSTQALYITCLYVIKEQFAYLEDEWINMSSHIGKKDGMSFGKTWAAVNTEILRIINSDEFHIQAALLCTTQLMLLNQRDIDTQKSLHVQHLRNVIIGCFPDKAILSPQGKEVFARILPPENNELYGFYNRILAGFSKIIVENRFDDIRNGLEYISRKRLNLPIEGIWPAPSESDALGGDPCWLLWGMILAVYPNNVNIATNYKLFILNWRKSVRNERIGLLWGLSYIIDDYSELVWTESDTAIFEKVKNASSELWHFAISEHKKLSVKEDIKEDSEFESIEKKSLDSFYESFVPRKVATNDYDMDQLSSSVRSSSLVQSEEPYQLQTKVLTIGDKNASDSKVNKNFTKIKKVDPYAGHRLY